jgi:hypothetical protein
MKIGRINDRLELVKINDHCDALYIVRFYYFRRDGEMLGVRSLLSREYVDAIKSDPSLLDKYEDEIIKIAMSFE